MSQAREWYRWKRRGGSELYVLWGLAGLTYGGGDLLTTIIMVYAIPGLDEANPFVHWGISTFGVSGLVAMKLAVFAVGIYLSHVGLAHRDQLVYYTPPLAMICFGIFATVFNLRLIL